MKSYLLKCTDNIIIAMTVVINITEPNDLKIQSIYKFGLSVWMSVRVFVSNKRQNG